MRRQEEAVRVENAVNPLTFSLIEKRITENILPRLRPSTAASGGRP